MSIAGLTFRAPSSPVVNDDGQESSYQRFATGMTWSVFELEKLLSEAGFSGYAIDTVQFGYFRKAIACLRRPDNSTAFAKIALHPFSVSLLEQESRGIAAARSAAQQELGLPDYDFRRIGADRAIALMPPLPGSPATALSTLQPPPPPFRFAGRRQLMTRFIDRLFHDLPESRECRILRSAVEALAERTGVATVPVAPAHGDFVYWNILRDAADVSVVDFESYKLSAIAGYDKLYWYVVPLTRFAIKRHLTPIALLNGRLLAPLLWQGVASGDIGEREPATATLALALMMAEHGCQMLREHGLPDIQALIGRDALALRTRQIALYARMAERLTR